LGVKMKIIAVRVTALTLAVVGLIGLYIGWLASAVAMGFASFLLPILVCVAILAASPLLLARMPASRPWSASLAALRWVGVVPFVIGLYFAVLAFIQFVLVEHEQVHGLWVTLVISILCICAILWPEVRWIWQRLHRSHLS
jgi:hypothetical protein